MATQANLLVKDDTNTSITLYPVSSDLGGKGMAWRSNISGVPIDGQIRLTVTRTRLAKGGFKVTEKLEVPKMETLLTSSASGYTAAPKVAYVDTRITSTFSTGRTVNSDLANLTRMGIHISTGASSTAATEVDCAAGASGAMLAVVDTMPVPFAVVNGLGPT